MADRPESVARLCRGLDEPRAAAVLRRFAEDYFERFDDAAIAAHLDALAETSPERPVRVLPADLGDGGAAVSVVGLDRPFLFSLIAGVLFGEGFTIHAGDVFTVPEAGPMPTRAAEAVSAAAMPRRVGAAGVKAPPRREAAVASRDPLDRGLIVDHVEGRRLGDEPFDAWAARVEAAFARLGERLAEDGRRRDADAPRARGEANRRVVARLAALPRDDGPLPPVEIELDDATDVAAGPACTRLTVRGRDTPAFLFNLATALSLHGLELRRARIRQDGPRVCDTLDLVDRRSGGPLDEAGRQRARVAALLTKQFTRFLARAPDPLRAVDRFGRVIEDLLRRPGDGDAASLRWDDLVENPRALGELSRLLGASDYLWEDFIRGQYESLLPLVRRGEGRAAYAEPPETLPLRLEKCLEGAVGLSEQRDRLNRFKDREVYLIDLDHLLAPASDAASGHATPFRGLSRRLTALAEALVTAATRLVYADLVRSYGEPRRAGGAVAPHAVFGLGKLGGVALGYASDIELLFLYEGSGKTAGGKRKAVSNAEFFETLTREASQFIKAKREGIFEVDLRLRPYGKDSPLAVSVESFRRYFLENDARPGQRPAHPFERLALVRLRWIAGDAELGHRVEGLRDSAVYDRYEGLRLDPLWELLTRGRKEKLAAAAGRFNAKHGVGGLADLETAVQLLQVRHATHAPQLRTPRIDHAMEALHRASLITASQYADVWGAYGFLRELINALRVLRGNARDLFVPRPDEDEAYHLARRMHYRDTPDATAVAALHRDVAAAAETVVAFFNEHFGHPPPA